MAMEERFIMLQNDADFRHNHYAFRYLGCTYPPPNTNDVTAGEKLLCILSNSRIILIRNATFLFLSILTKTPSFVLIVVCIHF